VETVHSMNERHPAPINIEGLRQRIRVMAFDRGTPRQVSLWRADISDSRANLVIEGMTPTSDDDDLFALMLDEGVPVRNAIHHSRALKEEISSPRCSLGDRPPSDAGREIVTSLAAVNESTNLAACRCLSHTRRRSKPLATSCFC